MMLWRLRRRVKRNPEDGQGRILLARALRLAGDGAGALAEARAAVGCALDGAERVELGELLYALGQRDAAGALYREAWLADRSRGVAAARWGVHLVSTGRAADAVDALRDAVAGDPEDDNLRQHLVTALRASGAIGEAAVQLEALSGRRPQDVSLRVRYGTGLIEIGRVGRGIDVLREAYAAKVCEETVVALGVALGRADRGGEAVTIFERYITERPGSLSAQVNCGVAYGEIGDFATAVRYLLDAAHRAPHVAAIQQNLAVVFSRMGQLDAAIDALTMASRLEPSSATIQLQLARLLGRRGDVHDGLAAATMAINLSGDAVSIELAARELRESLMMTATGEFPAVDPSYGGGGERPSAMSGVLTEFPLPNLLEFLRSDRRTGLLQIVSLGGLGEVRLHDGDVTSVSASQIPRLGELLEAAGCLTRPDLEEALATRPLGRPLGLHLVERGAATPKAVHDALREQAQLGLMELLPWEQGHFSFMIEKDSPVPEAWPTQGLLLDALRKLDEQGYADAADSIEVVGELFGDSF